MSGHFKNTTLESFVDLVKNDVQTATSTNIPTHYNLTPAEKGALQVLKEREDIVIKSADKGSAIVVMDKVDYLEEANKQLTDERFYKNLDSDPTEEFSTNITQELKIMTENSHIDKNISVQFGFNSRVQWLERKGLKCQKTNEHT